MKIIYTDINGSTRRLEYRRPGHNVAWLKTTPVPFTSTIWAIEDGSYVQIPDNAWAICGITYREDK